MKVRVLFFARIREIAGAEDIALTLRENGTLRELLEALEGEVPALGPYLPHCRVAVNREFHDPADTVPPGAEVAIIPPVSGGSARSTREGGGLVWLVAPKGHLAMSAGRHRGARDGRHSAAPEDACRH